METQIIDKNQNPINSQKMNYFDALLKELEELDDNDLFYEAKKLREIVKSKA